jgi:hypothetical protein
MLLYYQKNSNYYAKYLKIKFYYDKKERICRINNFLCFDWTYIENRAHLDICLNKKLGLRHIAK